MDGRHVKRLNPEHLGMKPMMVSLILCSTDVTGPTLKLNNGDNVSPEYLPSDGDI